ncbi:MAG: alpha/beta hydrolase [Anaerolineaceae bacterium]|nr:alpha/beta hydrolase [Anaerolineaceae bacterium]
MDTSPHKSSLANVNGIHLHYLDWGGNGSALLFLAGLNTNAHIFDRIAPRFTDKFHTLALTRRGDGESEIPETGYDLETLTDDIRLFLDYLQIDRAILVQHTNEGIELPRFAARFPERVLKLVFLEPPYDRNAPGFKDMIAKWPKISYPEDNGVFDTIADFLENQRKTVGPYATSWCEVRDEELSHQLTINPQGKVVYKGTEGIWKAIREMRDSYTPDFDFAKISAPTLSIFPIRDNTYYIFPFMDQSERAQMVEFYDSVQLPWYRQCIENFRRDVPHAKIVELQHSHTYFIITQEELVFNEMRMFLQDC